MGFIMSIPGRVENAIGKSDRIVTATVISFGLSRAVDPRTTASANDSESPRVSRAWRMKITITIPVWTATANNEMYPMITAVVIE